MNCPQIGLLGLAVAGLAAAQGAAPAVPPVNSSFNGTASFGSRPTGPPAITGASYSGEQVAESVQVLADGTRITRKLPGQNQKIYRDFAGRTRTERPMFATPPAAVRTPLREVIVAEIYDPVAGFRYTLDTVNHVAHRQKVQPFVPPAGANPKPPPVPPTPPAPVQASNAGPPPGGDARLRRTVSQDSVGTQLINGVQAEGHRTIETIPAEAEGNDRPITIVSETWFSPELKITVLSKRSDPRSGDSTIQILNLSRVEPDPSLFTVPPDYSVVDEAGSFTIRVSGSSNVTQSTR
jgi:hypothetical protein